MSETIDALSKRVHWGPAPPVPVFNDAGTTTDVSNDDDLVEADGSSATVPQTGSKFEVEGPFNWNDPVHENITIAALGLNTTLKTIDDINYEYIRGIFWNDDPRCLLFRNNSRVMTTGYEWKDDYDGKQGGDTLTRRSHFGDLQFLHAMGSKVGEQPTETRRKIFVWLKVMYQVWRNYGWRSNYIPGTLLQDTELVEFFPRDSKYGKKSIAELLIGESGSYNPGTENQPLIWHRALGTCLHLIQDSFAQGHCARVDAVRNGNDKYSTITNFHCYEGQDKAAHAYFDEIHSFWADADLDPRDVSSFDKVTGGRAALDMCIKFIALYQLKDDNLMRLQDWFDFYGFVLDANATPSNNEVPAKP